MNKRRQDEKDAPTHIFNSSLVFEGLVEQARKIIPGDALDVSLTRFQKELDDYHKAIHRFLKIIKETPLLAAFLDWIQSKEPCDIDVENARTLMERKLISFVDDQGKAITISDLRKANFDHQVSGIRCHKKYSYQVREQLVRTFISFFKWLSTQSGSFIRQFEDPDAEFIRSRRLGYDDFLRLLELLDERCRVIAKLLYFGGRRTLEEVITLQISDIDFENSEIDFDGERISYPLHVFEDIRALVGQRPSGAVFEGRNNTSINPSTIFRSFKVISSSLGFQDFSPKTLTDDR